MPLDGIAGNRELIDGLLAELGRRPSHAYLFSGPRGIGKAAVAAGLAHSTLCERSPGPQFCCTPERCATRIAAASTGRNRGTARQAPRCDCCAACVQVALGVHPDFTSVARQPNRTEVLIEQVRDLIERLGLRPSRGDRRVAIIDDAETLNLPAQNALLKTLEEPPGHTIIFMVTQSERALLDTVRSRMRPVRFGPLSVGEIASVLAARAGLDADRANALARLARGSLGHALSLSEGDAPPIKELLEALSRARSLDFAGAQSLAQDFFASREQAVDNFELIARLLEEMLCFKLLRENPNAPSPEAAKMMTTLAEKLDVDTLANLLDAALKSGAAIDAMANSRLQAEQWWMTAGQALRGN
jgi:DNA polymerase III subunit delta'